MENSSFSIILEIFFEFGELIEFDFVVAIQTLLNTKLYTFCYMEGSAMKQKRWHKSPPI
jgi:hypothetical protein